MSIRFSAKRVQVLGGVSLIMLSATTFYALNTASTSSTHVAERRQVSTPNPTTHTRTLNEESILDRAVTKIPENVGSSNFTPSYAQASATEEALIQNAITPAYQIENQPISVQEAVKQFKDQPMEEPGVGEYNYALEEFDNGFEIYRERE
jgi:hypothetical protein